MLTVIYAVYVVGTVTAMFFFGRLSDQVGRRLVVLISLGIAAAGALVCVFAQGTWWLFPARILSGLGIALVSGAATAWIVESEPDANKAAATQIAIGANSLGLAIGSLMAGFLAQYAPWPLRLSYLVFIVLLIPVALVIWKTQETVHKARSLGEASIAPRLAVPGKFSERSCRQQSVRSRRSQCWDFILRSCRHSSKRPCKIRTKPPRVAL